MVKRSVCVKNGNLIIDGEDKGQILSEKPDNPSIFSSFRKVVNVQGVDYPQIWVYRGDSWLCFSETEIESYGAFTE